jgi:Tol biopolymer transport system component
MNAKVKPTELQQALDRDKQSPVYIVDADGNTTHVVLPVADDRELLDQWLRRELQIGFEQADRGESQPWDVESTLAEAHRRHAQHQKS